ncbi:carbohydrate-binding module family 13 protein [Hyaloscypha hepaticicola]|uniref:Carbohydrate-binding module family 13 protein n=1 Tax=Hyaloscypha hepaticicola TaxID=2082293 RepID=A0A2J6QLL5_9HELO|nr:carbohydrate-binding module family 13 protein [Hyaloscypha hepaticicola]
MNIVHQRRSSWCKDEAYILHLLSSSSASFLFIHFQRIASPSVLQKILLSIQNYQRIAMHFSTLAVLAAAFASFAFANDAAEASAEATEDVQQDYTSYITKNATGAFLDLYLGKSCQEGGTAVNGWAGSLMKNKNTHQIWVIEQAGPNNQVQIINLGSGTAVYCSYPAKSTSGKALGGPTQVNSYSKFYAKANGDGSFTFQSVAAWGGKSQCLDLSGSNKASRTPVLCYPCHNGANQRWNLWGITYNQLKAWVVGA